MANYIGSWMDNFNPQILERGREISKKQFVRYVYFKNNSLNFESLVISSNLTSTYIVTGVYKDDGQVLALRCTCPWAEKGHLCKHMAAVLITIDTVGKDVCLKASQEYRENGEVEDISFKDIYLQSALNYSKDNSVLGDPLEIAKNVKFSYHDYEEYHSLNHRLRTQAHYFEKLDDSNHRFVIEYRTGYLEYTVRIIFDIDTIKNIEIESPIRNFEKNAFDLKALFDFVEYYLKDNPLEDTNEAALILLDKYKNIINNDKDTYEENNLPIKLYAYVENAYSIPEVSFKLGQGSHLYKIKNLISLVDDANDGKKVSLGKFFDRVIDVNQMDESSKLWFYFLEEMCDYYKFAKDDTYTYYYNTSLNTLPVADSIADRVDNLLQKGAVLHRDKATIQYEVSDKKIPMKISTDPETKTAKIFVDYIVDPNNFDYVIWGNQHLYFISKNKWINFKNINPRKIQRSGIEFGSALEFGAETMPTFGRKILPILKESNLFEIEGEKQLEAELPPVSKIFFKLDFQDKNIVCRPSVKYGEHEYQLLEKDKNGQTFTREFNKEEAVQKLVEELGFIQSEDKKNYEISIDSSDKVDYFFDEGINQLKSCGKVEATAAFKRLIANTKTKFTVSLGIRLGENTIKLEVKGDELTPEDIQTILNAYQEKKHYFMLRDGQMRSIDSPSIEELSRIMEAMDISLDKFVKGKLAVPAYRAFYLEKMLKYRNNLQYTSNDAFNKLIDDLDKSDVKVAQVPNKLENVLRPYQTKGFEWLTTLVNYQLGGLLADEMGLGKTLQVISILLSRKDKNNLPSLVVVPASVVYNWEAEFKKFAPELKVLVLGGSKKERSMQLKEADESDVLITSYDSLKRDLEEYGNLKFDLEVIDEAQNIKNARAAVAKAVKVIDANHRIALTDTPIENNLSELWSIFDYLMPGFLGTYDYFKSTYEKPIVKDGNKAIEKKLSQIIAPFILRRLKKNVLKDMPNKNEQIVYAKLSGKQNDLYQAQSQKLIQDLNKQDDKDFKKQRFQVLAAITKLRELCCDPHLLYEDYRGKSAKLETTLGLINDSLADGHKILLFSQFTSMLAIIEQKLVKNKIPTYVITGSTPKQKRQELIQEFNDLKKPAIFLISLKAGGTGINLTSADVVIHYDPWWNVAAENQATDRAHRIGQKNDVTIYKMVAKDTIEENIVGLQEKKEKLAEAVLSGENIGSNSLDKDDLLKILGR